MTRTVREEILRALRETLEEIRAAGRIAPGARVPLALEVPRQRSHGDLATNVAFLLAQEAGGSPRELAEAIVERFRRPAGVARAEVAGPGFINFFLDREELLRVLGEACGEGAAYGRTRAGAGKRVLVEFVSANPTGPLHVGHGRNAAVGDSLASVLEAAGFEVAREYYLNDTGTQMDALGRSLAARVRQASGGPEPAAPADSRRRHRSDLLPGHGHRGP